MPDHRSGPEQSGDPAEVPRRRYGKVPPHAVVPPVRDEWESRELRPGHLYKAVALLFLFAVILYYLEPLMQVALLAYAAAIAAIVLNAIVQVLPGRRGWMTAVLGVAILSTVGLLMWIGIPLLLSQFRDLVSKVPEFNQMLSGIEQWVRVNTGLNITLVSPRVQEFLSEAFLSTAGGGGQLLTQAQVVMEALLIPLLILFGGLYAAGSPNKNLLNPVLRAVPRDRRLAFRRVFQLLGDRILGWVKGLLLAMLAVGVLSYIGYMIAGVPSAFALALFAGFAEAIPLVGPWIGGSAAIAVGLLEGSTIGLYAAIVALVVQQIESNLITPWAMSQAAEVHPFVTLFALVLFGKLFGFIGILLSIPLVLLIWTLVEVLWVERAIDTDEDPIQPMVDG